VGHEDLQVVSFKDIIKEVQQLSVLSKGELEGRMRRGVAVGVSEKSCSLASLGMTTLVGRETASKNPGWHESQRYIKEKRARRPAAAAHKRRRDKGDRMELARWRQEAAATKART
jgi:hypothetical protein